MQSYRVSPFENSANYFNDELLRSTMTREERIKFIKSRAKDTDGSELLKATLYLLAAQARVIRNEIWHEQCLLRGGYPGNQEGIDTIKHIDDQIAALEDNERLKLITTVISEISGVITYYAEKQKSKKTYTPKLYNDRERDHDEVTDNQSSRLKKSKKTE